MCYVSVGSYFTYTDNTQRDYSKGDHSYADVVKFEINIKISMLGTIPMHALWRKVVLFIIKIMKNKLSPIPKVNRVINRIV